MRARRSVSSRSRLTRGLALAASLGLLFMSPGTATAQDVGTVTGQVVDATSMSPLSGVQVYLVGTGMGTLTNQTGKCPNQPNIK